MSLELPPFEEVYGNFICNLASIEEVPYATFSEKHLKQMVAEDGFDGDAAITLLHDCVKHGQEKGEIEVHKFTWADGEEVHVLKVL